MLENERDRKICKEFSKPDSNGFVHCDVCPLVISPHDLMCKAVAHINTVTGEWEFDEFASYKFPDLEEE